MRNFLRIRPVSIATIAYLLFSVHHAKADEDPNFKIKYFDIFDGRVAFTAINQNNHDIYVLDFRELRITPIAVEPAIEDDPAFSPDGRQIAFRSNRSGIEHIYVANYDGSEVTQLTKNGISNARPSWSPDGKQIAFQGARSGSKTEIYVMNSDGSEERPLIRSTPKPSSTYSKLSIPRFSPIGDELLFSSDIEFPGNDIYVFNLETGVSKVLTRGYRSFSGAAWRSDGAGFAFVCGAVLDQDIWFATKGSSVPTPLIRWPGRALDPCWTDDDVMFFVSESAPEKGDFQLFVYDARKHKVSAKEKQSGDLIESRPPVGKAGLVLQSPFVIRRPTWTSALTPAQLIEQQRHEQLVGERPKGSPEPSTKTLVPTTSPNMLTPNDPHPGINGRRLRLASFGFVFFSLFAAFSLFRTGQRETNKQDNKKHPLGYPLAVTIMVISAVALILLFQQHESETVQSEIKPAVIPPVSPAPKQAVPSRKQYPSLEWQLLDFSLSNSKARKSRRRDG